MNFFGHAVVAGWDDTSARHVLGSMLPDFEAMVRVPLLEVNDAIVGRGIELHHRTDEAFHRARSFLSLTASALEELTIAGVRRGTARAVAHLATEMFLDGCLAGDAPLTTGYLAAIELEPDGMLRWRDGGFAFGRLRDRLAVWGAPHDYADPAFVLERLRDALKRRPALAIADEEAPLVAARLPHIEDRVRRSTRELLDELRGALGFDC